MEDFVELLRSVRQLLAFESRSEALRQFVQWCSDPPELEQV
jgi:hypothetical protein